MKINAKVLVLFVCLGLGKTSTSEAFGCIPYDDGWGGISTVFAQIGPSKFSITSTTDVRHTLDHSSSCTGLLWAKPQIIGGFQSCSGSAGLNHTSAQTSSKSWTIECNGMRCGSTYRGGGEHWWQSVVVPDEEVRTSESANSIYLGCSDPENPNCGDIGPDYYWNGFECTNQASPIIIAIGRGENYQLTSAPNGVSFDLDANGQAEMIGWTRADSDVALLAIDRNGDGRITGGDELFGNHTVPNAVNGFEALARMDYELAGIVRTSIHPGDVLFDQLLLWIDRNHNGISEPDELDRAGEVLSEISFEYRTSQRRDEFGNIYRWKGQAMIGARTRPIWDVLFTNGS